MDRRRRHELELTGEIGGEQLTAMLTALIRSMGAHRCLAAGRYRQEHEVKDPERALGREREDEHG